MIGTTIDGKYKISRLLGAGAMGSVYEAEHTATGRRVALKVITSADLTRDATVVTRFQREARAAGAIDTQHITQVLDAGFDSEQGRPFLVMEFMSGEDLQQLIKRIGPLSPDVALRVVAQACLGLQKAHEANVVHRDMKPANLFLAKRDAGEIIVKLLDFGIAKVKMDQAHDPESAGLTKTGSMIGSPLYMSPEQARGDVKNIDHRTDIWSMGIVMYQALCGHTPYQHLNALGELIIAICSEWPKHIQEAAPWVPANVASIVHRCLRHNRDERYQSAQEMFQACKALLPNGWNINEDMIIPLHDTARREVAQKFALTTALAGAQTAVVPHAGAQTTEGMTQSGINPSLPPPKPASKMGLVIGAAAVVAATGLGTYFVVKNKGHQPENIPAAQPTVTASVAPPEPPPTASVAVTASAAPSGAPSVAPAGEATLRRVKVVVVPADATVDIEGTNIPVKNGLIEISGKLGSNHRVHLSKKGKGETTIDVAITEDGPSVPKIEILPPGAKPAASAAAAPAKTANGIIPKYE